MFPCCALFCSFALFLSLSSPKKLQSQPDHVATKKNAPNDSAQYARTHSQDPKPRTHLHPKQTTLVSPLERVVIIIVQGAHAFS